MKDMFFSDYQATVKSLLLRNKSILDILSKLGTTNSRVTRKIVKSVTSCGCIRVCATKQPVPSCLDEIELYNDNHLRDVLCSNCKSDIEKEIGTHLFYLTALCNCLDLDIYDIILKEKSNLCSLGKFNLR